MVKILVRELDIDQEGVYLHCNSQNVLFLVKNQVNHERTKYIGIRFHKLIQFTVSGKVLLEMVHTSENSVDMLTEPVTTEKFKHCLDLLHVADARRK